MKYLLMILLVCLSIGISNAQKKKMAKRPTEKLDTIKCDFLFHSQGKINIGGCYNNFYLYDKIQIPLMTINPVKPKQQNEAYKLLVYNQPDIKAFNYINDFYLYNTNRK